MTGRNLRLRQREVEVHREGDMLSKENNILSREEDMLIILGFLMPKVEEEAEVESSLASHVERMGTRQLTIQIGKRMEEKLTSLRHKGKMLRQSTLKVEDCW
jgi:hypothetical protein